MTATSRQFLPILAGYIGLRVLLLITDFDQYAYPTFELSPVGLIGELAGEGWRGVPLVHYFDNCGGHLLWGLLTTPIFMLFGSSYMALKILPLLLGALDLWLIWDLSRRVFGGAAARVASLAFVLAPPTLLIYSMLAKGNHFEGLTFQLLTAWLWVCGIQNVEWRFRCWTLAALCAGFGIFTYSGATIWVLLLLVAHLATLGFPARKQLLAGAASFVLGLAPLIWVNVHTVRLELFVGRNLSTQSVLSRLTGLVHNVLIAGPGYRQVEPESERLLGGLWWLAYGVAWLVLALVFVRGVRGARLRLGQASWASAEGAQKARLGLLLPLLGYLPAFVFAYCWTDFRFRAHAGEMIVGQYRYLVPHLCFACLLFGALAQWTVERQDRLRRLLFVALLPLGLGVTSLGLMWTFQPTALGAGLRYPGYDKADIARFLLRDGSIDVASDTFTWDFTRLRAELAEYERADQEQIAFGLGREMLKAQCLPGAAPVFDLERILGELPASLRPAAARGVGTSLGMERAYRDGFGDHLMQAQHSHPEEAVHLVRGLSSFSRGALSRDVPADARRANRNQRLIPYKLRAPWREGQGEFCGALLARGIEVDEIPVLELMRNVPELGLESFWTGVALAWKRAGRAHEDFLALRSRLESDQDRLAASPSQ